MSFSITVTALRVESRNETYSARGATVNNMNFYEYKEHIIYPTPRIVMDSGYWRIQLTIRYKNKIKLFSSDLIFGTKGEAVFHCIAYGKRMIDEGIDFDKHKEKI